MRTDLHTTIPKRKWKFLIPVLMALLYIGTFAAVLIVDNFSTNSLIVFLVAAYFAIRFLNQWIIRRAWRRFGEEMQLQAEEGSLSSLFKNPSLHGNLHGLPLKVWVTSSGYGRYKKFFTNFEFTLPEPIKGTMFLKKKDSFRNLSNLTGFEKIESRFYLETDIEWVKTRLLAKSEIVEGLFELVKQCPSMQLSIEGGVFHFREKGIINDASYLVALGEFLHRIASLVKQYQA